MVFYIQDSDDVYGRFGFHPSERQSIQSQPEGRFLSLSFLREAGTLGDVRLAFTALYIPAGTLDPVRARDGVLNGTSANSVLFSSGQSRIQIILPIRNDAFLQNGARFLVQVLSQQTTSVKTWLSAFMFCMALAFNVYLYGPCFSVLSFLGLPRLKTWDNLKCLNNLLFSGTRVSRSACLVISNLEPWLFKWFGLWP